MNNGEEKIVDYSYKAFKGENIKLIKPKEKKYTDPSGKDGSYKEVPILCSYGEAGDLYTGRGWMVEYCPVWSDGLRVDEKEYSNKDDKGNIVKNKVATYQAKITFDRREKDHMELVNKLDEGHLAIAKKLIEKEFLNELSVNMLSVKADEQFNANEKADGTGLKRLVHYHRDDKGKIMEGVGLSQFIRLRGTPKSERHTTFIDLKGNEIPWEELINCDFFWVPLILYTHIYSSGNGKLSVQRKVESGIVIKRKPRGGAEKQKNTLKYLQNIYPAEMDKLSSEDYISKENGDSTPINESKEEEEKEKTHQPAPLNVLQKMASGGQYSPPIENQTGFQTDAQGKPTTNTIQVPLIPTTIPQNNQPTTIPQNNTLQYNQPTTIPQNNAPQYNQPTTIPQNNVPQYNQPTTIPQNSIQAPVIPQNNAPQYNQPIVIPGAMTGVPSVGIPQVNQQLQQLQG